jgi:outer membrane receptor protein involved in Fe transport
MDDWKVNDALRLDAGVRRQRTDQSGTAILRTTQNLGDPQTLADDSVGGPGVRDPRSETFWATAWTVGMNYDFTPSFGGFARYTSSFRTPTLSNMYTGAKQLDPIVARVKEGEIGIKLRSERAALFATAFWNRFDPLQESVLLADAATGTFISTPFVSQTESYGLELEGSGRVGPVFEVLANLTLQRPRLENLTQLGTGQPIAGVDGNQIRRIAEVLGSITPILNLSLFDRPTQIYATVYHQGRRFVDNANRTELPAFTTLDAGMIYDAGDKLRVQVVGSNLTNEVGLTEGNPRVDTLVGQGTSTAIYARPIFGRTFRVSMTYRW